ncbi:N-acetyltransferase [Micromonospora schwarzwaldensis]|uniref:N-acetyltransferase n=1 Tax=Micromonospora sp. DSM 45708 TaxID=3111767 RepID=UPI0031E0EDC8
MAQVDALSGVIADALCVSALAAWLVPDASERAGLLRAYARLLLDAGMRSGQVHATAGEAAVSVWYERRVSRKAAGTNADELRTALGRRADRFVYLHTCLDAILPQEPHAYLSILGVRPGYENAAVALLEHRHRLLDTVGQPAYTTIVTAQPRESLFTQLGYVPRSPMQLERAGPTLWRMWRSPQSERDGLFPHRARLHQVTPLQWGRYAAR